MRAKGLTCLVEDEPGGRGLEARARQRVTDGELVRRALAKDRWAEEALFRRYAAIVAGTVMRLLGDRAEAEDVVQETFVTALEKLDTVRDPERVRAWLLAIAVRDVQQRFRRRKLKRLLGLERSDDRSFTCADWAAEDASAELRAELQLLDRALGSLPAKERIPWMLRHVEGYSLEETAVACGCSLATAKRRIAAAERYVRAHVRMEEVDGG